MLIGTTYGEQLARKQEWVRTALGRYASLGHVVVPAVVGSPRAFGYRNQAKLVARRTPRGVLLGIYRPGTHRVVDIRSCPVHHPLINEVMAGIHREIERHAVSIYDERRNRGWLRHVVVRVSAAERSAQVILVVTAWPVGNDAGNPVMGGPEPGARACAQRIGKIRRVSSVVVNVNAEPGNAIFGETFVPLGREAALIERVGPLKLKSRAGAFLQANIPAARRVYRCVAEWADLQPEESAVDLYAGVGAISFHLAGRAGWVCGVESSPIAVLDAKANIRLNGFHNVRFFCGSTATVLPDLLAQLERIDVITLNPPRKGADEATRTAIGAAAPTRIVYVSCAPLTLARDLDWFAARGYHTVRVQPFDLLPQTEHVECVALLRAGG